MRSAARCARSVACSSTWRPRSRRAYAVDRAFFGTHITDDEDPAYNAERPAGLEALNLANITRVTASPTTNLDPWSDLYFDMEAQAAPVDAWVTTPAIAKALAKVKVASGSQATLLIDYIDGRRTIYGAPVYISPHVTTGSVWAINKATITTVLRNQVEIETDASYKFQNDQIAIRSRMRLAWGFPALKCVGLIRA